ncbi:MAG: hypothetical protein V4710_23050 [Verrucomicrobiota bacterium]
MKSIGGNMFFFGIGSIILNLLGMEFIILAWIDIWGDSIGWAIRIGLTVVGGALWMLAGSQEESAT